MPGTKKKDKKVIPSEEMPNFSWGGTTPDWEKEADKVMHVLQDQIDDQETQRELKNKVDYGKRWQYWH